MSHFLKLIRGIEMTFRRWWDPRSLLKNAELGNGVNFKSGSAFDLILKSEEALTAERTLRLILGDQDRVLDFGALSGANISIVGGVLTINLKGASNIKVPLSGMLQSNNIVSVAVAGSNITLSAVQNDAAVLILTGTPGATRTITLQDTLKLMWVINNTDSVVILSAGAGTVVKMGPRVKTQIYTDGATNVADLLDMRSMLTPARTVLFDSFLQNTTLTASTAIQPNWSTILGSDAACAVSLPIIASGRLDLVSGAGAGATMAVNGVQVSSGRNWRSNQPFMSTEFSVLISDTTNVCAFFGFTDQNTALEMPFTLAAGDALTSNATDAVGFLFDTAADTDNVWLVGVKTDVDATKQNTGVALNTTGQIWRVELDNTGQATFYLNGAIIGSAMANACATNVTMCVVAAVFSRTNASKTLSLNYVYAERSA